MTERSSSVVMSPRDLIGGDDLAQQAAHDFAGACFGQSFAEANLLRPSKLADFLGDPFAQLGVEFFGRLRLLLEGDEGDDYRLDRFVGRAYR